MTPAITRARTPHRLGEPVPAPKAIPAWKGLLTIAIVVSAVLLLGKVLSVSWQDIGAIAGTATALVSLGVAGANSIRKQNNRRKQQEEDDRRRDQILEACAGLPKAMEAVMGVLSKQDAMLAELSKGQAELRSGQAGAAAMSRAAVVGSSMPTWCADANGNCTFVNHAYETLVGRQSQQLTGTGWEDVLHPDDRESLLERWQRCARERVPFSAEVRYVRPDGAQVRVRVEANLYEQSGLVQFVGTSRPL